MTLPIASTISEAMHLVGTLDIPAPEIHTFPLNRVMDRVLAQDFYAPFMVPGFVRSRLDGFAVLAEDLAGASLENIVELTVIATMAAGDWPAPRLASGQCVRIMAGAAVPENATAVVGFEDALAAGDDDKVCFAKPVREGAAIGMADISAAKGELLVGRGMRLDAVHLARLASVGVVNAPVFSRPRVAVLSTGSELLLAGMPPSPGKIYNSGQTLLCALLTTQGAIPLPCGIARDDVDAIAETMQLALRDNTMLITTGGVGNGDYDCILAAMQKAGAEVLLAGGNFRPGGNFALARLNGKYILSLSGAPGSALIILHLLGIPLVHRLTHANDWQVKEVDVILAEAPQRKPRGLVAGSLEIVNGQALFRPLSLMALERKPLDLVMPLDENDDIEALVAEKRPLKAWLCH